MAVCVLALLCQVLAMPIMAAPATSTGVSSGEIIIPDVQDDLIGYKDYVQSKPAGPAKESITVNAIDGEDTTPVEQPEAPEVEAPEVEAPELVNPDVDAPADEIVEDETLEDEVIAVIAAAVAAMAAAEGTRLAVKSFRRVGSQAPAWNRAGRQDIIANRF